MTTLEQAKNALESLYGHENELVNYYLVKGYLDERVMDEALKTAALFRSFPEND